jgi:hypothetical protein
MTPAGWYADPHVPGYNRWWDGNQWTDQSQPMAPTAPPANPYVGQATNYGMGGGRPVTYGRNYGRSGMLAGNPNQLSLLSLGFSALYLVVAFTIHFVLIGIMPALYAYRAIKRREKLAIPAMVVAALVILLSLSTL